MQPWAVTGWSTGSGCTVGNPILVSHCVTRTEVASRVTESGDVTRATRTTAPAVGRW